MSNPIKKKKQISKKIKVPGHSEHAKFLFRVTKSLYYGKLPTIPCLSLPVTELSAELFSEAQKGKSLRRLHVDEAAELTRNACVSPCSLVLALLYLERLKTANPEYVTKMAPSELFLVSLMISNKFILEESEEDTMYSYEWASMAGITCESLKQIERNFLSAIDWRVYVSDSHFEMALEWLEHQVAIKQARLRGWFTYADLSNIASSLECADLLKCLVTVYVALSVSYLASVSTLLASSLIVSHSVLPFAQQTKFNIHPDVQSSSPTYNETNRYMISGQDMIDDAIEVFSQEMLLVNNLEHNSFFPNVCSTEANEVVLINDDILHQVFQLVGNLLNNSKILMEYIANSNVIYDYRMSSSHYITGNEWESLSHSNDNPYSVMWQYPRAVSVS